MSKSLKNFITIDVCPFEEGTNFQPRSTKSLVSLGNPSQIHGTATTLSILASVMERQSGLSGVDHEG